MVDPGKISGEPTMLISGNDRDAKLTITSLLKSFGWKDVIDLGDIKTARATEMLVPLWLSLFTTFGNPHFAFKIVGR